MRYCQWQRQVTVTIVLALTTSGGTTPIGHYCTCLGHLGRHDTDAIISILCCTSHGGCRGHRDRRLSVWLNWYTHTLTWSQTFLLLYAEAVQVLLTYPRAKMMTLKFLKHNWKTMRLFSSDRYFFGWKTVMGDVTQLKGYKLAAVLGTDEIYQLFI